MTAAEVRQAATSRSPACRHFVVIESNTTGTGRLAIERLLRAGHRVTFLARQPETYPFLEAAGEWAAPPGCSELTVEVVETNDLGALIEFLEELRRRRPIDVVLTFSDYYIALVAEVAAHFGMPYLDPLAARRCRDKSATRETLAAAGLPTPEFHLAASVEQAGRIAEEIDYPCVLKPVSESSSAGVLQVSSTEALLAHFAELHDQRANSPARC